MLMSSRNNCDINIMIRGIGGQGVKLAGTIIGQAAIYSKRYAIQSMKYGSAITGGETRSEIKVSINEIIYPRVTDIDVYVALTLDDLENYFPAHVYICATEVAKKIPKEIKDRIILAPMMEIAENLGNSMYANTVMLGILNQLFSIASDDSFIKAIEEYIPKRFIEDNIIAYKKGASLNLSKHNSKKVLELADVCRIKDEIE